MKKVTLNGEGEVKFLIRGVRHSRNANEVCLTEKGVVMSDSDAEVVKDRLGEQVTVSRSSSKDAEKEAAAAVKEAEKAAKEAEKEAEKAEKEAGKKAKADAKKAEAKAKADEVAAKKAAAKAAK